MKHLDDEPALRFGVYLTDATSRKDLIEKCQRAEYFGYDVIGVADHLKMWAPFLSIMIAAEATQRPRLTTAMLNTAFYAPALLARDAATTDLLTDGRLELGLGTGYTEAELDLAGISWPPASQRVDHLTHTVSELRQLFSDPDHHPHVSQPSGPPLWIGGRGNRVLALAAREADIIGFTGFAAGKDGDKGGLASAEDLDERVRYVRDLLGDRIAQVELNIMLWRVVRTNDRRAKAERLGPTRSVKPEQLLDVPTVLIGTTRQMTEQIQESRQRYGFTYFMVRDCNLDDLAPAIEHLR